MAAAVASKKGLVSGASSVTSEVESSSSTQVSPAQGMAHIQFPMATPSKNSQIVEGEGCGRAATVNYIYSYLDHCSLLSSTIVKFSYFAGDRFLGD